MIAREAVLDTILTSVPIVTLDSRGHIRRITPVAAELLDIAPEVAVDRPFSAFVSSFHASLLEKVGEGGILDPPPNQRWTTTRPDGAITSLIIHADILPDEIEPEHAVLTLADQTQADAAKDRSHALSLQLQQMWRLNSLGEMAATLAHELNQPLTAATVYLHAGQKELSQAGLQGESAARTLEMAKTQLLRAGEIIRRTRELISSGSRTLTQERVSHIVADLIPALELISREADVPIRLDIHDVDDEVLVDRIQVQQAVSNLVRNAIDAASSQNRGQVRVTGRSHEDGGYELTVEDNGPGIPDDRLAHIFEPMMTTKPTGMGLGLPVTRSIIENHGGQIAVSRSEIGGASFSFRLPPTTEFEAA